MNVVAPPVVVRDDDEYPPPRPRRRVARRRATTATPTTTKTWTTVALPFLACVFAGNAACDAFSPRSPAVVAASDGVYVRLPAAGRLVGSHLKKGGDFRRILFNLAAMVVATEAFLAENPDPCLSIAFLLTSDEEGPSKDGTLVVVNRALTHCHPVPTIARTLQAALDDWDTCEPQLQQVYQALKQAADRELSPLCMLSNSVSGP